MHTLLKDKLNKINDRLDTLDTNFNVKIKEVNDHLSTVDANVVVFEDQVKCLLKKVDVLENRERRNNLIIHDVKELAAEISDNFTNLITNKIFKTRLGTTVTGIERCHKIGRLSEEKLRPVIVRFLDYREKQYGLEKTARS